MSSEFTMSSLRLDGRVAVVTGGGRGLGLGIALALEHVVASEPYLPEIDRRDDIEVVAPPEPWSFAS